MCTEHLLRDVFSVTGPNDEQVARTDTAALQKGLEAWNRMKPNAPASFAIKAHYKDTHTAVFLCRRNIAVSTLEAKIRYHTCMLLFASSAY